MINKANPSEAYEQFKMMWMIDHGFKLGDLISELDKLREDYYDKDVSIQSLFEDWEDEYGFGGGSIWPCYDEFLTNDYPVLIGLDRGDDDVKLGFWVVYSDEGIQYSDVGSPCFATKREAIEETSANYLDGRKRKLVTRIKNGKYRYTVPGYGGRGTRAEFIIEQVTKDNIDEFKRWAQASEEEEWQ